jgi:hypothetical protein
MTIKFGTPRPELADLIGDVLAQVRPYIMSGDFATAMSAVATVTSIIAGGHAFMEADDRAAAEAFISATVAELCVEVTLAAVAHLDELERHRQ